jgi:hypothetical protein
LVHRRRPIELRVDCRQPRQQTLSVRKLNCQARPGSRIAPRFEA